MDVAASIVSSVLVVIASVGVLAMLAFLLPAPRAARAGLAALTVLVGLAWGIDQIRLAHPQSVQHAAMTRLNVPAQM